MEDNFVWYNWKGFKQNLMSRATHLGLGLMEIVQKYKYLDVKIEIERN